MRSLVLAGLAATLLWLHGWASASVPEQTGPTHPLPDFPSASPEAVGLSSQGLQAATAVLQAHIDAGDIPGAVAAVVRDGHLVYHEALGWQDVESATPMIPDALFRIYSMTRPITSMGVLLLAEDGVLEVNEPVRRFLPDFAHLPVLADPAVPDPQAVRPRVGEITLAHLLTHTSGIGSRSSALYRTHDVHGWDRTLEEVVDRLTTLPLFEDPGTRYRYGMHAEVLGRVVEVATGVSYEAFLTERILGPLGMDDTGFTVTVERAERLVPVHRRDGEGQLRRHPMEDIPVTGDRTLRSAGVGLVSTAADILRFSRALLEEGPTGRLTLLEEGPTGRVTLLEEGPTGRVTLLEEGPTGRVPLLAREGRERMLANAVPDALFPLGERGYWRGSGWSLGGMAVALDPEAYTHPISLGTAWWDGSVGTRFWVDPTENLIIVVMSQVSPASGGGFREAFKGAVMEAVVESREESGR